MVMQRIANPCTSVRFRSRPPRQFFIKILKIMLLKMLCERGICRHGEDREQSAAGRGHPVNFLDHHAAIAACDDGYQIP